MPDGRRGRTMVNTTSLTVTTTMINPAIVATTVISSRWFETGTSARAYPCLFGRGSVPAVPRGTADRSIRMVTDGRYLYSATCRTSHFGTSRSFMVDSRRVRQGVTAPRSMWLKRSPLQPSGENSETGPIESD